MVPPMQTLTALCDDAVATGRHASRRALALQAGMAPETLSRLLSCRMRQPGAVLLAGLAQALGVDLQVVYDAWARQCRIAEVQS